ncbi:MAG: anti-phage protein KwaB [Nitrosomonas sp.]|nr:anti-phage protein KwaB [Nitrosomonas sp.]MDP1951876.1 anti-phage protein KwaB [Nitrosomonas sp.]
MNAEELKAALQPFFDNYDEIGISVYAILKSQSATEPKKLDIEAEALLGLKAVFMQSLREEILEREELAVLNLSTSDERTNAIYVYDLEIPAELATLESVSESDDFALLDLAQCDLSDIKALLIEIGNNVGQIVLYKTMAPVNIFGRASFFLKKSRHRLEQINDEFLRVSAGFQMMQINGELLVVDLHALERNFGFHEVITREAASGIAAIESISIIENPEVLHELLDEVKYARRFTKVARSSPVLMAKVPNASIIEFCRRFPKLTGKIRFNDAGNKIVLDTKLSKDLFIKLLMDDFLTSELTHYHYESVAKDSAEEVGEAAQE